MRAFWNKSIKTIPDDTCIKQHDKNVPIDRFFNRLAELSPEELRRECNPAIFEFSTTEELAVEEQVIGQDRALKALDFGLHIKSKGFNIFVAGLPGTGKNSAIMKAVKKIASKEPVPDDICYLYNLKNPDMPRVVTFPSGLGRLFKADMESFIHELESEIENVFSSEKYEKIKRSVLDKLDDETEVMNEEVQHFAESKGSEVKLEVDGMTVVPQFEGHTLTEEEYEQLPHDKKENIRKVQREVSQKIFEASRTIRNRQKQVDKEMGTLDRRVVLEAMENMTGHLLELYGKYGDIPLYLEELREDVLNNLQEFKKEQSSEELVLSASTDSSQRSVLSKYTVNLIVDNSGLKGAPVIIEQNPTYYNLNGSIEYKVQMGAVSTDHMMIRAGAVHRASGGYLILRAQAVVEDPITWDSLKKILLYGKIKIENMAERYGYVPAADLKPLPLEVDLKVIMVGSPDLFQMFYSYDEDFVKLFKVKADFEDDLVKSGAMIQRYVGLIARICRDEKLCPCSKEAVAKIIDYGSRLAEHKDKLSAQFLATVDLLREANYWALKDEDKCIRPRHIIQTFAQKCHRSNSMERKLLELIEEKTILIDVSGAQVGQVNGVSIIDLGDYVFGKPSRITARTFVGSGTIINIEREAQMSGRIHSKGVLILSGYLGHIYAQEFPLAMSASICFEQHYEEIEGDSASSAELYCLLSSLSGCALRQDLAVTGSVDQRGQIQPVGGINLKIEGFFNTCSLKGLTGTQGVLIPASNVKHLMLNEKIVRAVREGYFHIIPIENIDQGIGILTNKEPGTQGVNGFFPQGSIHYLVNQKLKKYASIIAMDKDRF